MMTAIKNRNTQKQLMLIKSVLLFLFALTGLNKALGSINSIDPATEGFSSSKPGNITYRPGLFGTFINIRSLIRQ